MLLTGVYIPPVNRILGGTSLAKGRKMKLTMKFNVESNGTRIMDEVEIDCELHADGLGPLGELAVQCMIAQKFRELARQQFPWVPARDEAA